MLRNIKPYREAWVFSGGGAKGYYLSKLIHLFCKLTENGLNLHKPSILAGSSIGAIQAAALAELIYQGKSLLEASEIMLKFWQQNPLRLSFKNILLGRSLFSEKHVEKILGEIIKDPNRTIADYKKAGLDLIITVTDLKTGRTLYADPESSVIEAAIISSALPIAFPSHSTNGLFLSDGGALENVPANAAVKAGATSIRIGFLDQEKNIDRENNYTLNLQTNNKKYKNGLKVVMRVVDLLMSEMVYTELEEVEGINRILYQAECINDPQKKAEYLTSFALTEKARLKLDKPLNIFKMRYIPITKLYPSADLGSVISFSKRSRKKRDQIAEKDFQERMCQIVDRYLRQLGI